MIALEDIIQDVINQLDYPYDDALIPYTDEELDGDLSYHKQVKTIHEAERFNYHSDYWGSADYYQEQNVIAMEALEPVIGEIVKYEDRQVRVIAMLIDRQYNSIGHTKILVEEIGNPEVTEM